MIKLFEEFNDIKPVLGEFIILIDKNKQIKLIEILSKSYMSITKNCSYYYIDGDDSDSAIYYNNEKNYLYDSFSNGDTIKYEILYRTFNKDKSTEKFHEFVEIIKNTNKFNI